MIPADFLYLLSLHDFGPFTGVPCSLLGGLIKTIECSDEHHYYIASSEGESMGIAAGFSLSGKTPVVLMQNDGFGNVINPLSSLQIPFKLPSLLVITWRGEPKAKPDAIQHKLMGEKLLDLLNIFDIPFSILDESQDTNSTNLILEKASSHISETNLPYALIIKRGFFDKIPTEPVDLSEQYIKRALYIKSLLANISPDSPVLGTTGFTGRELTELAGDHPHFYMPGSMGCLPSIGLGLAKSNPNKTFYVLDGDGALLMKLGSLATLGHYAPSNLVHILFDNRCYESTGGQETVASTVNFEALALDCGYLNSISVDNLDDFNGCITSFGKFQGPYFVHVKISTGTINDLSRPSSTPEEHKNSFIKNLA